MVILQYDVYWISLDPIKGGEMSKTRPCVIVSPNELNKYLLTVIIAPITSTLKAYPWRIPCLISEKAGNIAADQIKTIDKSRINQRISTLSKEEIISLKNVFKAMLVDY